MRRVSRLLATIPIAILIAALLPTAAQASIGRPLSGNGEFFYNSDKNLLRITDWKNGDYLYAFVGFNAAPCGSVDNACEPSSYSQHKNHYSYTGYTQYFPINPTAGYIFIKLCNEDAAWDTCTSWKMTLS